MTIDGRAEVLINSDEGLVNVSSHHILQNKRQRVIGAVSVLFVLQDEMDQENENEKGIENKENVIPASLSIIEVPFGVSVSHLLGSDVQNSRQNCITPSFTSMKNSQSNNEGVHNYVSSSRIKEEVPEINCEKEGDIKFQDVNSGNKSSNVGKKPDPKCFTCGDILDSYEKVVAHCKLHNIQKSCPICAFEFKGIKNNLKRHSLGHIRRPEYSCPYKTCNSTFSRKDNLQKHILKHKHRQLNPHLSLINKQARMNFYKVNKRKRSCYNLPTLVKVSSAVDTEDMNMNCLESMETEMKIPSDSGIDEESMNQNDLKKQFEEVSGNVVEPIAMEEDVPSLNIQMEKDCVTDVEQIEQKTSTGTSSEKNFNSIQSLPTSSKKSSIDSVISRISRRATHSFYTENPDLMSSSIDSAVANSSLEEDDSILVDTKVLSQGEVVFPHDSMLSHRYSQMNDIFQHNATSLSPNLDVEQSKKTPHVTKGSHNHLRDSNTPLSNSKPKIPPLCHYCGLLLETVEIVKEHHREHQDVLPHDLTCIVCTAEFSSKDCLRRHVRNHFGIKFQCTLCSNSYSRNENLKKHMRETHGVDTRKKMCSI